MDDKIKYIIAIGASAGGLKAIAELIKNIDRELNTAIFVVLHVSRHSVGKILVEHLQKHTTFRCMLAEDLMPIKKGHLYIAQPDFHLIVKETDIRVVKGPHENRWRPSIDVLFRSAAAHHGQNTIGIILSGMLNDGTAGMSAIKRSGGICIVQEPEEAEFADMPLNVINTVEIDYRVPLSDIGYIMQDIFAQERHLEVAVPEEVKLEAAITERMITSIEELEKLGSKSNYSCPDCGGGLWEIKEGKLKRYRCYNGHSYSQNVLDDKQNEQLEESLWISVRMLEERKNLLMSIAQNQEEIRNIEVASQSRQRAVEIETHIARLKQLLLSINRTGPANLGYD